MRIRTNTVGRALPPLICLAVVGLHCAAAAAAEAWAPFTSKAGRFTIEMPGAPVETETHQKSGSSRIRVGHFSRFSA